MNLHEETKPGTRNMQDNPAPNPMSQRQSTKSQPPRMNMRRLHHSEPNMCIESTRTYNRQPLQQRKDPNATIIDKPTDR